MSPSLPCPLVMRSRTLEHALGPDAAGHALAAALVLRELQEVPGEVDHAGGVVGDDHAARTHDGAGRSQALVVDRRVEQARRHAAARRPAELHGLELAAVLDAAADVEDDVAERRPHGDLGEAAVDDLAGQREGLGALAGLAADGGVGRRPVGDDPRHAGEGLDVVDVGGLAPEAGDRRERRPLSRHPALAHDGGDERGLLAADEGAGAFLDLEREVPAAAEDVARRGSRAPRRRRWRAAAAARPAGTRRARRCTPRARRWRTRRSACLRSRRADRRP